MNDNIVLLYHIHIIFFVIGVSAVWSGEPGNGLSSYSVSLWDGLQRLQWSGMEAFCSVLASQATQGTMHPLVIKSKY